MELWAGQGEKHHAQLLLEFVAGAPGEGLRETLAAKHLETLNEFIQIVERGKKEGKIPPQVDSEQVAWFITGFAFAGDVSQTMGFTHFLDPEISGRWLDVMFASFVAQPGRYCRHRLRPSCRDPECRIERPFRLDTTRLPPLLSAVAF